MSVGDPPSACQSITVLRRWNLYPSFFGNVGPLIILRVSEVARLIQVGDLVLLQEDSLFPAKWPLGKVTALHTGKDGFVRVVVVRTATGTYKRPVVKIALLLPVALVLAFKDYVLAGGMLRPLWNTETLYSNSLTHLNLDSHCTSLIVFIIVFIAPSLDTHPLVWVVTSILSVFTIYEKFDGS